MDESIALLDIAAARRLVREYAGQAKTVKDGELTITNALLTDFAAFLREHCPPQRGKTPEFSLFCPEDKLQLRKLKAVEDEDAKAGQRVVDAGGVRFLISFIEPKAKSDKPQPLKARHFALFNAGVYDRDRLRALDWARYKPFVMQLFGVRDDPQPRENGELQPRLLAQARRARCRAGSRNQE